MTIDKSGEWWKGTEFGDIDEYLRDITADGYPADEIIQSVCTCGQTVFQLEVDDTEGCARRTCAACGTQTLICDSEEFWDEAESVEVVCPCRGLRFEVGVAFSKYEGGDVRWITIGRRCVECGVLGSPVDWKIDYGPTDHLLSQA